MTDAPLLEVQGLSTSYGSERMQLRGILDVSFTLGRGRILGVVGESGSGKSTLSFALTRLLPNSARYDAGRVIFDSVNLLSLSERELRRIRGQRIAMVFQDPLSSLHPCMTIGQQMADAQRAHTRLSRSECNVSAAKMLTRVGIPDAAERLSNYPHQFSGGMRQRVMIGMNLMLGAELLIADEPTSALDVVLQDQIVTLLSNLRRENGMAMIIVSHDLSIIGAVADEVMVMYAGESVELSPADQVFSDPLHPYTRALLAVVPGRKARNRPLPTISGRVPSARETVMGCPFASRCHEARNVCLAKRPNSIKKGGRQVRCHIHDATSGWHGDTPILRNEVLL